MLYTETGKTWRKLSLISSHARRDKRFRFTSLAHLLNEEYLRDCYKSLNRNKAVGIDNVSWREYGINLEENISRLVRKLKSKKYKPMPAKRVYIPKEGNEKRALGIPTIENKIVERGITWILESIYEQDFLNNSYGFRPEKNCHQALKEINNIVTFQPVNHIVEADIRKFFDKVPHEMLLSSIKMRIKDTAMLNLIEKFLKAGYVDHEMMIKSEEGTPQGSILSPMLSNIYLHHVLDTWFENVTKKHTKGYCELIRYADDFLCLVRYKEDAIKIEKALNERFKRCGLELHPEKTRILSFGRFERENARHQNRRANTFDFLGFTHYCEVTRKGKFKIGRKTSRKKFAAKCKDMNAWLKTIRNQVEAKDWWKILEAKLRGHYQYYGISENYESINRFYLITAKMVIKWMNRRSQKKSMNWEGFEKYLKLYPLPKPRIVHNFYLSHAW